MGEQGFDAVMAWIVVIHIFGVIEPSLVTSELKDLCIALQLSNDGGVCGIGIPISVLDAVCFDDVILAGDACLVALVL